MDYPIWELAMGGGVLIGIVTLTLGGIPFALGTSAGCLLMGIFVSYFRSVNPEFGGPVNEGARTFLQDIGLNMFVAVLAANVGPKVATALGGSTVIWLALTSAKWKPSAPAGDDDGVALVREVAALAALPVLGLLLWQALAWLDGKFLLDTFTSLGERVAGESRVSSVPGLKERPSSVMRLPRNAPRWAWSFRTTSRPLGSGISSPSSSMPSTCNSRASLAPA